MPVQNAHVPISHAHAQPTLKIIHLIPVSIKDTSCDALEEENIGNLFTLCLFCLVEVEKFMVDLILTMDTSYYRQSPRSRGLSDIGAVVPRLIFHH